MVHRAIPRFGVGRGLLAAAALMASMSAAVPVEAQVVVEPGERAAVQVEPTQTTSFSSDGLVAEELAGGGVAVDLQGRFRHYTTAHTGPDGKLHIGCTNDRDAAHSLQQSPAEAAE